MECRMGWYFARLKGTDRITTVGCWAEKIDKEEKEDVEVIEQIPPKVIDCCNKGVKILNLNRILKQKGR